MSNISEEFLFLVLIKNTLPETTDVDRKEKEISYKVTAFIQISENTEMCK